MVLHIYQTYLNLRIFLEIGEPFVKDLLRRMYKKNETAYFSNEISWSFLFEIFTYELFLKKKGSPEVCFHLFTEELLMQSVLHVA